MFKNKKNAIWKLDIVKTLVCMYVFHLIIFVTYQLGLNPNIQTSKVTTYVCF